MSNSPADIRFAADAMLQSLAKWLRLLGYDCLAGDQWCGRSLVETAVAEGRWILSRNRTFKDYLPHRLLREMKLREIAPGPLPQQLRQVVEEFGLDARNHLFTRCVECNVLLEPIARALAIPQVPAGAQQHAEYWRCPKCARLYWKGRHVERTLERLAGWGIGGER